MRPLFTTLIAASSGEPCQSATAVHRMCVFGEPQQKDQ
jgi:hypothetical protein